MKKKKQSLADVSFKIDKKAFGEHEFIFCECGRKVKKSLVDFQIPDSPMKVKLGIFRCKKCGEEQLDFPNAKLLDKALEMNRLLSEKSYSMDRNLSFDGDNFILRVPNTFTKGLGKKASANLKPISNDSFLVELRKSI